MEIRKGIYLPTEKAIFLVGLELLDRNIDLATTSKKDIFAQIMDIYNLYTEKGESFYVHPVFEGIMMIRYGLIELGWEVEKL